MILDQRIQMLLDLRSMTLFHPSIRNVRIPCSIALAAIVEAAARLKIKGRRFSFSTSNS